LVACWGGIGQIFPLWGAPQIRSGDFQIAVFG
jgi:hypothetical protein